MYKVKVCGLMDTSCLQVLNECLPDYAGFILSPGFRRTVSPERAAEIRAGLDGRIVTVGVFVDDDPARIAQLYGRGIFGLVQLHGHEDEAYIDRLREVCPAPIAKAVGIRDGKVPKFPANCDYVLLDAYVASGGGGTGKKVEWRPYPEIDRPFFLAGGITPDNVQEGLRAVRPCGVDTSGGVETDGKKDPRKIREYIMKAREVRQEHYVKR